MGHPIYVYRLRCREIHFGIPIYTTHCSRICRGIISYIIIIILCTSDYARSMAKTMCTSNAYYDKPAVGIVYNIITQTDLIYRYRIRFTTGISAPVRTLLPCCCYIIIIIYIYISIACTRVILYYICVSPVANTWSWVGWGGGFLNHNLANKRYFEFFILTFLFVYNLYSILILH